MLEVGDDSYTRGFGGSAVTTADVLHVKEGNPAATIVGDLADGSSIPSETFDCLVLTQTLHLVYDLRAAVATLHRILRPGGVALVTVPGISQISGDEWAESWYWSLTTLSARKLFEERFSPDKVAIEAHGNALTATAFLQGLAAEELRPEELDCHDPRYQMLITVRAVR